MKNILIIFISFTLIAGGAYYFFVYRNKNFNESLSVSGFLSKLNFLDKLNISKKSEDINKTAQDLKAKTSDLFADLSKSFSATVGKVSGTVSLFDNGIKNNKLAQLISVLGKDSPTASSTESNKEVGVCSNFSLNQPVTYLIGDPFELAAATSTYVIDWGDGGTDKSIFATGTAQVSHIYVNPGEFVTKFKVESGESSAEVSRRVCIK